MRGIERSGWSRGGGVAKRKKRGRILQKMGVDSVESCGRSGANVHLWASFQMSKTQGEKRIVIVFKGADRKKACGGSQRVPPP